MGFSIVPSKGGGHAGRRASGVSFFILKDARNVTFNIIVGADVAERTRWKPGMRVNMLWGDGPDVGKIKVVPNAQGEITVFSPGRTPTLRVKSARTASWCPTDKSIPSTPAEYVIEDGALIVTLPTAMVKGGTE